MKLRPKNWNSLQHYKDRRPTWIKLHRTLLEDRKFMCLQLASKALAPMLWLLASENDDGIFDGSIEDLTFRLRLSEKEITDGLKPLIDNGFFEIIEGNASKLLAGRYQVASPETETETEREKEKNNKKEKVAIAPVVFPDVLDCDEFKEAWSAYLAYRRESRLKPLKPVSVTKQLSEMESWGMERSIQAINTTIAKGWQGIFEPKEAPSRPQSNSPRKPDGSIDYYADAVAVFGEDSVVKLAAI